MLHISIRSGPWWRAYRVGAVIVFFLDPHVCLKCHYRRHRLLLRARIAQ